MGKKRKYRTYKEFKKDIMLPQERFFRPVKRKISHVVFDADDTLWDVEPWGLAGLCEPAGTSQDDYLRVRCGGLMPYQIPDESSSYSDGQIVLKPGVRKLIEQLHEKGIAMSVVSQNDPGTVEAMLKAYGLADKFSTIDSSFKEAKSDMLVRAVKKTATPMNEVLYVDDMPNHVWMAEDLGAVGVLMGMDIHCIEELERYMEDVS